MTTLIWGQPDPPFKVFISAPEPGSFIPAATASLAALGLSVTSITENSAAATVVGAISGKTAGSTLSLVDTAGSRFALSGTNIVAGATATNFESATSHTIIVRETLAGAFNSPRDTSITINVINAFEAATLSALTLSTSSLIIGNPVTINIVGTQTGSVLTGTMPSGLTLNSSVRTITGTPTTNGTFNFALTETLGDSANSPRVSNLTITVAAAITLSALSLSANSLVENSAAGVVVGALTGLTGGSTITITNTAGNQFSLSGTNVVAGAVAANFEVGTTQSITIRETLAGATNSPRDTVLTVNITNVFEAASLSALTLPASMTTGSTVNISGATAGSTITGTLPAGWSLNSAARTVTVGAVASGQGWTLVETLGDSANSPRTSTGSSNVVSGVAATVLTRQANGNVTVESLASVWTPIPTRQPDGSITVGV